MPNEQPGADTIFALPIEIEIGGKKLKLSRSSIGDEAEIKAKIRSERLDAIWNARTRMRDKPLDWEKTISAIACNDPDYNDIRRWCSTWGGGLFLMWLRVRKNHPDITEKIFMDWATENMDICGMYLLREQPPAPEKTEAAPGNPSSGSAPKPEQVEPKFFGGLSGAKPE